MNDRVPAGSRQRGMSLIEMMIAMTISLIVIGAVSGVYLSTSRNYTQDEMLSRMQENARFALHVLSEDLSMAGYWGPLMSGQNINTAPRTCTPSSTGAECQGLYQQSTLSIDSSDECDPGVVSATPWANTLGAPIEFVAEATDSLATSTYACIDDFLAGSDILVVKRVEGQKLASTRDNSDDDNEIFLRTNGTDAMLFIYNTGLDVSEGANISDWRYRANVYYVRDHFLDSSDGIPTLVREKLEGNGMGTEEGGVAQGIEYFHVMFGIDQDGDATANIYTPSPTLAQLQNATSARIFVLARSAAPDPGYVNDKTYELGDVTRDFSTSPDNFYRRVFSTTVALRNQRNRILTTGN